MTETFKRNLEKGKLGEDIVQQLLQNEGWNVYFPFDKTRSHAFDMLGTNMTADCIAVDVKTKSAMSGQYSNMTGFNVSHFNLYKQFTAKNRVPFYVYFVDPKQATIHRVNLRDLPAGIHPVGRETENKDIYIWHIEGMQLVGRLNEQQIEQFRQLEDGNQQRLEL